MNNNKPFFLFAYTGIIYEDDTVSYCRTVCNETHLRLEVTLYIQAGANPNKLYGTLNISIPAQESMEVAYGDLRNSFLCGLRVAASPVDPIEYWHCRVSQVGDDVDQWLNDSGTLYFTAERLKSMESATPFIESKLVSESE